MVACPAPKVKVSAVIPNGWWKEATSDAAGLVRFDLPWQGNYVIEAHFEDKQPGARNGKAYDTASFVTALSFTDVGLAVGSVIVARLRDLVYFVKELLT
mgnify:CR=1 FL=1